MRTVDEWQKRIYELRAIGEQLLWELRIAYLNFRKPVDITGKSGIIEDRGWVTLKGGQHIFIGTPSVKGRNSLVNKGFKNKQALNNHWQNGRTHREEYISEGIVTAKQYESRAVELAESAADDINIFGHLDKYGHIIRYDKSRNDFVKADILNGIITLFKPDDGYAYYEDIKRGDVKNGGKE